MVHMGKVRSQALRTSEMDRQAERRKTMAWWVVALLTAYAVGSAFGQALDASAPATAALGGRAAQLEMIERCATIGGPGCDSITAQAAAE